MKRNKLFLINDLKKHSYSFLKNPVFEAQGSEYEVPFATEPTEGNHSLESCENCRKHRLELIVDFKERLKEFPNCCDYHKNLSNKYFFDKKDYKNIDTITANKIMYSYHHILNNLDNDDWYNNIITYLNYNIESFGKVPIDCGEPFQLSNFYSCLLLLLSNIEKEINSDEISLVEVRTRMNKIKKLIDIDNKPLKEQNTTDLNILLSKYDEWFKAFPFDLPYFTPLKEHFKNLIPLHTGITRDNKYLGITEHEAHTKESLTVFLLQTTQNILTNINGATLYETGYLNNTEKIAIDLAVQNRKLELLELSKMPNTKKQEYIKVLKRWFKQEKKFIGDITPLLKALPKSKLNVGVHQKKALSELITHRDGKKIIDEIKIKYKNIKGKRLKLLLIAFQKLGLLPIERIAKSFHDCCKNEFAWDISSYNAMNSYKYNDGVDKKELDSMIKYLEKFNEQQ